MNSAGFGRCVTVSRKMRISVFAMVPPCASLPDPPATTVSKDNVRGRSAVRRGTSAAIGSTGPAGMTIGTFDNPESASARSPRVSHGVSRTWRTCAMSRQTRVRRRMRPRVHLVRLVSLALLALFACGAWLAPSPAGARTLEEALADGARAYAAAQLDEARQAYADALQITPGH